MAFQVKKNLLYACRQLQRDGVPRGKQTESLLRLVRENPSRFDYEINVGASVGDSTEAQLRSISYIDRKLSPDTDSMPTVFVCDTTHNVPDMESGMTGCHFFP